MLILARGTLSAMGRTVNQLVMGPAGICNLCGRKCCTLDEAGIACYFCGEGIFIHRYFWIFRPCPGCDGVFSSLCDVCNKVGCLAIAKEYELDVPYLWEWMAGLKRRYDGNEIIPPLVAQAVAYAEGQLGAAQITGDQP